MSYFGPIKSRVQTLPTYYEIYEGCLMATKQVTVAESDDDISLYEAIVRVDGRSDEEVEMALDKLINDATSSPEGNSK